MQYYFDIAVVAQEPAYIYTQADHDDYDEPAEFTEAVRPLAGKLRARAVELRSLRPSQPVNP